MTSDWSSDVNHCLVPAVLCVCFFPPFFFCLAPYVNVLYCTTVSLPFTCDEWVPWIIFGLTKYCCVWLREALPPDINLYENIEIKGVCLNNGGFFLKKKKKREKNYDMDYVVVVSCSWLQRPIMQFVPVSSHGERCKSVCLWQITDRKMWNLTMWLVWFKTLYFCHGTELTEIHAGEIMSLF